MKFITICLLIASSVATNLRNTTIIIFNDIYSVPHNKYNSSKIEIKCKSGFGNSCVCPGGCMLTPKNNTGLCTLKRCWSWNPDLTKCEGIGPTWIPALVLQGIPFTGVFGAGFGNMGRWDLFAIGSGIWGAGFVIACLIVVITSRTSDDSGFISCYTCVFTCAVLVYWIWGIVTIANKSIMGNNGCPFINL